MLWERFKGEFRKALRRVTIQVRNKKPRLLWWWYDERDAASAETAAIGPSASVGLVERGGGGGSGGFIKEATVGQAWLAETIGRAENECSCKKPAAGHVVVHPQLLLPLPVRSCADSDGGGGGGGGEDHRCRSDREAKERASERERAMKRSASERRRCAAILILFLLECRRRTFSTRTTDTAFFRPFHVYYVSWPCEEASRTLLLLPLEEDPFLCNHRRRA